MVGFMYISLIGWIAHVSDWHITILICSTEKIACNIIIIHVIYIYTYMFVYVLICY